MGDFIGALNSHGNELRQTFSQFVIEKKICRYGEVQNFSLTDYYDEKQIHRLDRASEFASAVAKQALEDSKVNLDLYGHGEKGVCLGIANSIATSMSDFDESVLVKGPRRCDIGIFPNAVMCAAASRIAIFEEIKGSNTTVSSGRNSGFDAIGLGFLQIKYEGKKIILAGAAEALSPKILIGLDNENLLMSQEDLGSVKFSREKLIPTEGACAFLLSDEKGVARTYAEILAFNNSFSASKRRNVHLRSKVLSETIQQCLLDAKASPSSIDAVITSAFYSNMDREVEQKAISEVFSAKGVPPLFCFNEMVGDNFSAQGPFQLLCAISLINKWFSEKLLTSLGSFFPNTPRKSINYVLVVGVDSAGHNSAIIVKASA